MSSITLQETATFCSAFLNWANLSIGTNSEPLVTAANLVLQTLCAPPFAWPWNRSYQTFQTVVGVQDYSVAIPSYGYLETASVQMVASITSVTVTNGAAVYTAANNFGSLLSNGPAPTTIQGCTTSALNGTQTIQSATATTFTCNIATGNVTESESGATALAGPIMPLTIKVDDVITSASEQDRPSFICTLMGSTTPEYAAFSQDMWPILGGVYGNPGGVREETYSCHSRNIGDYMIAFVQFGTGASSPTISDTGNNDWIPISVNGTFAVWYCIANAAMLSGVTVTIGWTGTTARINAETFCVEVSQIGFQTFQTAAYSGTGTGVNASIGNLTQSLNIPSSTTWNSVVLLFGGTISSYLVVLIGDPTGSLTEGSNPGWVFDSENSGSWAQDWYYSGSGNPFEGSGITFRLLPVPNTTYEVNLTYQNAPTLFTSSSLNSPWGIPGNMQSIYSYFMLFLAMDYFDDPRAARYRQLANASLLSKAVGLDETDRNLFLGNWLPLMAQEMNKQLSTQQGGQARGI